MAIGKLYRVKTLRPAGSLMHTYWLCPGLATIGRGNNHGAAVVWNLHAMEREEAPEKLRRWLWRLGTPGIVA